MEIISSNDLSLSFVKVKSHSSNTLNNTIDNLIKQHHASSDVISFSYQNLSLSQIIPKWNNIIIDSHLHWDATFKYFDSDADSKLTTNFRSSYQKSHKIKILIEELPTVEHIKKC
ncbi:hypothetical protein C1645_833288 [Glomus cerebriforme]|uniref:RNase H type-1 domain-containing protein n=1 Tax=Glomus cerebriforme TaxID=658196 RepID=A0A397SLT1_9GLOM|nr:hypothetical protein C1645_833288 [Glomus cerebriforme]